MKFIGEGIGGVPLRNSRRVLGMFEENETEYHRDGIVARVYYNIYRRLIPDYFVELERELEDCRSLLDLGCGDNSPVRYFHHKLHSVGVDIFEESDIHDEFIEGDALEVVKEMDDDSFDAVLASALIEHMPKDKGWELLDEMERVASGKAIVQTPSGFLPQEPYGDNPHQEHLSGWTPEEFRERGYRVIGLNGWKPLRGERAVPKIPVIGMFISDITQPLVRNRPEMAFEMMATKEFRGFEQK